MEATHLLWDTVPAFAAAVLLRSKDGPNAVLLNLEIHADGVVLKSRLQLSLTKGVTTDGDSPTALAAADSY